MSRGTDAFTIFKEWPVIAKPIQSTGFPIDIISKIGNFSGKRSQNQPTNFRV